MEAQYAEAKPEDVIRKALDAWNRHDAKAIAAIYSPDAVEYGSLHPEEGIRGREAIGKQIEGLLMAFPDAKIKLSNVVPKDDMVWYEWEATGTHKGTLQMPAGAIPATNRPVKFRGAVCNRISRGLIVEERGFWDPASLIRQLGLKPS